MSRAKDYLQKVKADEDARAACEKQIAALESCAYRITPFYGVRTGSGGAVNSDDKIARLMDAKAECEAIIKSLAEYKAECMRLINELENGTFRLLLTLRYINYLAWPAVASRMNYSVDHVIKMHGDALAAFEIVLKDNGK